MSQKNERVAAIVERFQGRDLEAHYLAFFECFNQGLFFEAHEVLEKLWLPHRHQPDGPFYQGLIQFAGAFVHLQRGRPKSAISLLRLARANISRYPAVHHRLHVTRLIELIDSWLAKLESSPAKLEGSSPGVDPLSLFGPPQLALIQ